MTLHEEILAKPELEQSVIDRNCEAIAAALSVGRTRLAQTEIGNGKILETLGLADGNTLLDAINASPMFKYVVPLLEQGRLDVSTGVTRSAIDYLVSQGAVSADNAAKLKALAEVPDVVTPRQVAEAMYNDDGSLK